jgi:large subunit ribosomal protein L24
MKIKKGDQVQIIAGKDRGKRGKVLRTVESTQKALIEGLNLIKKHRRPKKGGEKGQRIELPSLISVSNLMFICTQCGKLTRLGYKLNETSKTRVCKKCKAEI